MSAENTDEPEDATANYLQDPEAAEPHPRGGRTSSPSPSRGFLGGSENAPTDGPAVDDLVDQLIVPPASVENSGRMAESQGAHPGGDTPNEAAPAAAGAHADHDRGDLANGHAPEKNVQEGLGGDGKSSSSSSSSSSDDSEPSDFELRANPAPVEQAPKVNDGGWGNEDDLDEDDDPAEDVPAKEAPPSGEAKRSVDPALEKGLDAFDELDARSNGVKSTRATQAKAAAAAAAKDTNWGAMSAQFTALTGDSTRGGRGGGRGGRGGGRGGRGGRGRGRTALPPRAAAPVFAAEPSWSLRWSLSWSLSWSPSPSPPPRLPRSGSAARRRAG